MMENIACGPQCLLHLSALSHGIVLIFVFGGAVVMFLLRIDKQRFRYAFTTLLTAFLLSAFWVVPFLGGHSFMTDMKYGSEPGGGSFTTMWDMYFPLVTSLDILLVSLSIVGFVASIAKKRFFGVWMGTYSIILMIGVKVAQGGLPVIGLLWNPRIYAFHLFAAIHACCNRLI